MTAYGFQAYCDICKRGSEHFGTPVDARLWRHEHFAEEHPDNPMRKQNCRIKRLPLK